MGSAHPLRALMVAPFERGLDHGGSQRATAMAERLEERGATVDWQVVESRPIETADRLRSLLTLRPAIVEQYPRGATDSNTADVAIASHSYLVPQLAPLPATVVRAIDFHNLEWRHLSDTAAHATGARRVHLHVQSRLLRRFEEGAIRACEISLFTSPEELGWAQSVAPGSSLQLLPSVLPVATERAALALEGRRAERNEAGAEPELLYVGTLSFPPHMGALRDFLVTVWPAIRKQLPGIRLTIAGDCTKEDRLGLSTHPGVSALGFVDKIGPLLERSAAVVMPTSGLAGTSMRALYYALAGVWVIGTPAAFRGLGWQMGRVAESPDQWAQAVREAAEPNPQQRQRLKAARVAALALQRDPTPWDELVNRVRLASGASQAG